MTRTKLESEESISWWLIWRVEKVTNVLEFECEQHADDFRSNLGLQKASLIAASSRAQALRSVDTPPVAQAVPLPHL